MSIGLILSGLRDNYCLLTLPYWTFALEIVYFALAVKKSFESKRVPAARRTSRFITTIYEIAFSFQAFSAAYYCLFLIKNEQSWKSDSFYYLNNLNLHFVGFIIIWIEQAFNLVKFNLRHIWFILCFLCINAGIVWLVKSEIEVFAYGESINFQDIRNDIFTFLVVISPFAHFVGGYLFYQFKKKRKNERRKLLSNMLISYRSIDEKDITSSLMERTSESA